MAKREELRLDVEVKGAKDVDKLAESLEEVESASEQARKALIKVASTADAELRDAASAAEALGRALGPELAGRMDVSQVTADLNRMGVSFDEIRAEADQFATTLKQLDDIKLQQTNAGLDNMRTKLDGVRNNADQSRSVLANLAGNAAQDLGELGGVVGSLGVGIGQMAEYAVDGNIALSNLAKVAGPMAGLSAALLLVQHVMGGIAKEKAFDKAQVEDYTDAILELGEGADAVLEHLQAAGKVEFAADSGFLGFGTTIKDITGLLDKYGITAGEVAQVIAGTEEQQRAWFDALAASGVEVNDQAKIMEALRQAIDGYGKGLDRAERVQNVFGETLSSVNAELQSLQDPLETMPELWEALIADVADGTFNFENAAAAIDILAAATGMGTDEIIGLAKAEADLREEELAEKLEADADAALELAQALADLGDTIGEIDADDLGNIGGALTEALDAADATIDFQSVKEELRGAFTELEEFIAEEDVEIDWAKVLDTSQDTGLPPEVLSQIAGIRDQFQEGIGAAFDIGGEGAAQHFADSFIPALMDLGLSEEQAYALVGLPPGGDIGITLKPFVDAEAKADALAILDSLIGVDPNNPVLAYMRLAVQTENIPPQVAEIAARILAGEALNVPAKLEEFSQADIDAAYALLEDTEVVVPTAADQQGARDDIAEVEDDDYEATIDGVADTATAAKQLLDEASRHRTATIYALADFIAAKTVLDGLTKTRTALIRANALTAEAEAELNDTARNRTSTIYVNTVRTGGGGGGGAGPQAQTLAPLGVGPALMTAPMTAEGELGEATPVLAAAPAAFTASTSAVAPVTNVFQTTIQAGMIGNRHEMDRMVSRAMRRHARLNGSRN